MKYLLIILLFPLGLLGQTVTVTPIGLQDVSGIPITVEQLVPGSVGYNVASTTYSYESTAGTNVYVGDDQTRTNNPIGFTFNYWGTNYTAVNICSNGWISFTNTGGNIVGYSANSTVPAGIHGVATDLYPISGYYIRYQTIGTAPYRKCVVSYHVGYYGCFGSTFTDFQFVLHETTNKITINVASHPGCSGRAALQGLSNQANNQRVITPNRNGTNWGGTVNSSYEFTPYSATATWQNRGTLNTNAAGQVSFSNPSNYDYRVTIDASNRTSTFTLSELNYLNYLRMFPNEITSWDFHTMNFYIPDSSDIVTYDDVVLGYQTYITNLPYSENYIYSQSEKDDIEVNANSLTYHLKYIKSPIRTFNNLNQFYIVSLGKHRRTTNTKTITQ